MKFDFTDLNVCVDYIKDKQNTQRKERFYWSKCICGLY